MSNNKTDSKQSSSGGGGASTAGMIVQGVSAVVGSISSVFIAKEKTEQVATTEQNRTEREQIKADLEVTKGEQNLTNNLFNGLMGIRQQTQQQQQQQIEQQQFEKNQAFYGAMIVVFVLAIIFVILKFR